MLNALWCRPSPRKVQVLEAAWARLYASKYNPSRFLSSTLITKNQKTTDEQIHQDLAGTPDLKKNDLTTKQWVGYNPFVDPESWKGVADWISFLSQNVRMETLAADAQKARATKERIELQGFNLDMIKTVGKELNAAILALVVEGKVKLYDDDHWYIREYKPKKKLPTQKTPGLKVEAIDLSGTKVIYEGLENLYHLEHILHLSLSDCKMLDEWGISRLAMIQSLVSIDISHNPYITERSLLPLKHIPNLRRLDIRGIKYFRDQPIALIMLEEHLPNCVIVTDETSAPNEISDT